MRKKPYTTSEFFETIVQRLKDKGSMPDNILDYSMPTHCPEKIKHYVYEIENRLRYGGNEGIYLEVSIKLYLPSKDGPSDVTYHLGTFKTLLTSPEAMRTMGTLLADFIVESRDFIDDNIDDFTWYGYEVRGYTLEGKRMGYEVQTLERANQKRDEFFNRYDYAKDVVTITNNATKEVTEWTRAAWTNLIKGGAA